MLPFIGRGGFKIHVRSARRSINCRLAAIAVFTVCLVVNHYREPWNPGPRVYNRDWTDLPDNRSISFRDQFTLWDKYNAPGIGRDSQTDSLVGDPDKGLKVLDGSSDVWFKNKDKDDQKFFIYRCDSDKMSNCGGWADRLQGALAAYVIANLTNRIFKFEIKKPACDITFFLKPNLVDWQLPVDFNPPAWEVERFLYTDKRWFKNTIHELNFDSVFGDSKYVYFQANMNYLSGLRESTVYKKELAWMHKLSPADIYATLYKRLFKISPKLEQQLDSMKARIFATKKHRLVCAQVRMGRNPTIATDSEVFYTVDKLPTVWNFIRSHAPLETDSIFLMSDSTDVIEEAKKLEFKSRMFEFPGEVMHIDKITSSSFAQICSAFERLLLEFHLLMNCDVLLRSVSGLSTIASFLRGADRDLYCLYSNGTSRSCERNDFSRFS